MFQIENEYNFVGIYMYIFTFYCYAIILYTYSIVTSPHSECVIKGQSSLKRRDSAAPNKSLPYTGNNKSFS